VTTTVAVVLAAGGSIRLGRPKQLLEYRGEPLVRHAARVALGAGCDRTIVVWGAVPLDAALSDLPVELLENEEWREGIASSIRAAVHAAPDDRLLFTVSDQPLVTAAHLRQILAADAPIAATGYSGSAGVPAAFAGDLQPELLALRGDRGARSIIDAHVAQTVVVPFDAGTLDIDSEEDYRMLINTTDPPRRN
jgi:molybdenum cofactor cytidylyltransferase